MQSIAKQGQDYVKSMCISPNSIGKVFYFMTKQHCVYFKEKILWTVAERLGNGSILIASRKLISETVEN